MNIQIILLALALSLTGVLLRPLGWLVFAIGLIVLVLNVAGGRLG